MRALTYESTLTSFPRWGGKPLHEQCPRGYSYEFQGRFFHISGMGRPLWQPQIGIAQWETSDGLDHRDWLKRVAGAQDIVEMASPAGTVVDSVWRPGIDFAEMTAALRIVESEQHRSEQSLRLLVDKLDEILLFIEPSPGGLDAYGHKTRELLLLACMEVENSLVRFLKGAGATPQGKNFTTVDFVRLAVPLCLKEYQITFKSVPLKLVPFQGWDKSQPTRSLPWYDAYNRTKHDRDTHFAEATLRAGLSAIAAAFALFCVRYGPYSLTDGQGALAALFRQLFSIELVQPDVGTFYIPKPAHPLPELGLGPMKYGDLRGHTMPWTVVPLVLA